LRHDVEAKAQRRVFHRRLSKLRKAAIDVASEDARFGFFEAQEVLLVKTSQAIDTLIQLGERRLEFFDRIFRTGIHAASLIRLRSNRTASIRAASPLRYRSKP
jgi:hypothetical protein